MGRCKSVGRCAICNDDILTYDDYEFYNFLDESKVVCIAIDPDRNNGIYEETDCYSRFIKMCLLQRKLDYLNLEIPYSSSTTNP